MSYTTNSTEDYINNMYQAIGIYHPYQLNPEDIAIRNGISLFYMPTKAMNVNGAIVLDSRSNRQKQWQDFSHELCHALWHAGSQVAVPMPLQVYQERKSNNFAQYACIPPLMLREIDLPIHERDGILLLQETFNVEWEFAEKRLQQHLRNIFCR